MSAVFAKPVIRLKALGFSAEPVTVFPTPSRAVSRVQSAVLAPPIARVEPPPSEFLTSSRSFAAKSEAFQGMLKRSHLLVGKTPESVSSFCREFVIWFPAPKTSAPEAFETRFATPTILLAIPETTDWEFRDSLLFSEPRIVAPNPWKLCFYR